MKASRHDHLTRGAGGDREGAGRPAAADACPRCGAPLDRAGADRPVCAACGWPDEHGGWVAYDGC